VVFGPSLMSGGGGRSFWLVLRDWRVWGGF